MMKLKEDWVEALSEVMPLNENIPSHILSAVAVMLLKYQSVTDYGRLRSQHTIHNKLEFIKCAKPHDEKDRICIKFIRLFVIVNIKL